MNFLLRVIRLRLRLLLLIVGISIGAVSPFYTYAQVVISEIAWMGTAISANHEWIELHNTSDAPIDISNWILASLDEAPTIVIKEGSIIPANGFFLLERTSDNSVPGILADMIYTGALGNTGEHLVLANSFGTVIDEVAMAEGWLAGDNVTKETMQRTATGWITAKATPKAPNATVGTPPSSPSSSNSTNTQSSGQQVATTQSQARSNTLSTSGASADKNMTLYAGRPRTVLVGQPVEFVAELLDSRKVRVTEAKFTWVFGDGTSKTAEQVRYAYRFPGTYVVMLNARYENQTYTARTQVVVLEAEVSVERTGHEFMAVRNNSTQEINLAGWTIVHQEGTYYIPEDTILLPGATTHLLHPFNESAQLVSPAQGGIEPEGIFIKHHDMELATQDIHEKLALLAQHISVLEHGQSNKKSPVVTGGFVETPSIADVSVAEIEVDNQETVSVDEKAGNTQQESNPMGATTILYTENRGGWGERFKDFIKRWFE